MNETHRDILRLALPSVVANITVPLLGLVDTTIVGHLGRTEYIAAIAIGSTIFTMCYWLFSFLRMGTTGLVAQAVGARDNRLVRLILYRSVLTALLLSALLVVCRSPILHLALRLMPAEAESARFVAAYYDICIWGAPAALSLFALNGWFIGCQDTRSPMLIAILQNLLNIALSLLLVFGLGWRIEGVATGTLAAQWCALGAALLLARRRMPPRDAAADAGAQTDITRFLRINRDIFLRTLCLMAVTLCFTAVGTRQGSETLSANALLLQLFYLYSFFTDSQANAGEALSGKHAGAADWPMLRRTVRCLFVQGAVVAVAFTLLYLLGGPLILHLLTDQSAVVARGLEHLPWAAAIPIIALPAMVWDGVFIGLTWSRQMLLSMFAAASVFFVLNQTLPHCMPANHALWLAFDAYLLTRGAVQTALIRCIIPDPSHPPRRGGANLSLGAQRRFFEQSESEESLISNPLSSLSSERGWG